MKLFLKGFIIFVFIASCQSKDPKSNNTTQKIILKNNIEIKDKRKFSKYDSISLHALDKVYFGEMYSAEDSTVIFNKCHYDLKRINSFTYLFELKICLNFEDNSTIDYMHSLLSKKYGKPKKIKEFQNFSRNEYKSEREIFLYEWDTKFKIIKLGKIYNKFIRELSGEEILIINKRVMDINFDNEQNNLNSKIENDIDKI